MHRLIRERVRERLWNWGRWAGGWAPDDPALVDYYEVSPMFVGAPFLREGREERRARLPVDDAEAEISERILLKMLRRWPYEFVFLRAHYAWGYTLKELAQVERKHLSTMYRVKDRAEGYFHDLWKEEKAK